MSREVKPSRITIEGGCVTFEGYDRRAMIESRRQPVARTVQSFSRPGVTHIIINVGDVAFCTCESFNYRGQCRHTFDPGS